jgi:hypothetical protein
VHEPFAQAAASFPWATLWVALGSLAAFGALILAAFVRITSHISRQNETQIKLQREQKERDTMFKVDWYGQSARPGVPSSPGVMERLSNIEHNTAALPDRVSQVERDITISRHRQDLLEKKFEQHVEGHTKPGGSA